MHEHRVTNRSNGDICAHVVTIITELTKIKMIPVALKPLIYCESFNITKNVCFGVFRPGLVRYSPGTGISLRFFTSKSLTNIERKPIILSFDKNSIVRRQVSSTPQKKSTSPIKWKSVIIVTVFGSIFVLFLNYLKNEKLKRIQANETKSIGRAKIGGKFNLIDQDNKPMGSDDFLGQWILIYFGFTHCPDICPAELEKMIEVIDKIDENKNMTKVKPVFITVDPERDTPSVIKKYLKEFSDKIIGLTGTKEQVNSVCKAFRIYFSAGPRDVDSDYIVDHSIIMYLIDPQGELVDYFGQNKKPQDIIEAIHSIQLKQEPPKSIFQKISEMFSSNKM